jgi:hypothetical protein
MSTSGPIKHLLADPERLATVHAAFEKARDAAIKAQRGFADLESKAAALAKERAAFETWLHAALARLAADRAALQADVAAHEARRAAADGGA